MKKRFLSLLLISLCLQLGACAAHLTPALLNVDTAKECHPTIDNQQTQWIIGYGSLMQEASRLRTAPLAKTVMPVDIAGFQRGWFATGSNTGFSTTYLGAIINKDSGFNAVVFTVNTNDVTALDTRESGYCRTLVQHTQIHPLSPKSLASGQYWMYTNTSNSIAIASKKMPLVQSYVDIFISGCFEQEQQFGLSGFALRCINTSDYWSTHWVNDRPYPRRPFIYQPQAGKIDALLKQALPKLFNQITLE